jgi:hypothetical protein
MLRFSVKPLAPKDYPRTYVFAWNVPAFGARVPSTAILGLCLLYFLNITPTGNRRLRPHSGKLCGV